MIRTRDLFVFVAVLLFLGTGIAITLLMEHGMSDLRGISTFVDPSTAATTTYSAQKNENTLNREDIITRLRNALALNPSGVEPSPSVEDESPQVISDEEGSAESLIQSCGGDDAAQYAQSWPLSGVALRTSAGMRTVVHTKPAAMQAIDVNASTTASSSPALEATRVLISFPLAPSALSEPQCVPSDVVGVTVSGSLMFNSDASFYRGYGQEYLIGYARDGFPIYGYYEGEVDACGGYMHPAGYRYAVSPDRDHIISCFKAHVSLFSS